MKEENFCLECGKPLKGKADKKFCDDQSAATITTISIVMLQLKCEKRKLIRVIRGC